MKLVAAVLVLMAMLIGIGRAEAATSYGSPPELAGIEYQEPRVFVETQGWWVEGQTALAAPGASFPFESAHVHLGIPFPLGEQFIMPASGSGVDFPYLAQYHENVGGAVRQVRGGMVNQTTACSDDVIPSDPGFKGVKVTEVNQRHAGVIPFSASKVNCWRDEVGTREFRFTADTTSKFGKRQYQSGAWNAQFNAPAAPVAVTARGWYEGPGYTNVTLTTKVQAHTLASGGVLKPGSNAAYSLAQGAKWAFAYIDANIHAGIKGTVLFENRTAAGSFTIPAGLTPGDHVLLLGGWEKTTTGWNAGVLRLPFHVAG